MARGDEHSSLPLEIIFHIVEYIATGPDTNAIALPSQHPTTKTLLALTSTSRAIYPLACRLLYTHCVYINTASRQQLLLRTLTGNPPYRQSSQNLLSYITSLYLQPFTSAPSWGYEPFPTAPASLLPQELDMATARKMQQLLGILSPNLRRLLIDVPLRSLYPEDDIHGVRPIIRSAFTSLRRLEGFCTARDELYLDVHPGMSDEPAWHSWQNLKVLALYNPDLTEPMFWHYLAKLSSLETVIFTRADGLHINLKSTWRNEFTHGRNVRPLNIILVDVADQARSTLISRHDNHPITNDEVRFIELALPMEVHGVECPATICQDWVKEKMLSGIPPAEWSWGSLPRLDTCY